MIEIEAMLKSIRRLLNAWPQQAGSLTPAQTGAYLDSLRGFQIGDVDQAIEEFIQGRVEGRSVEFLPPGPAVAAKAVEIERERIYRSNRATPLALPAPPMAEFTEDERQARREMAERARLIIRGAVDRRKEAERRADPEAIKRELEAEQRIKPLKDAIHLVDENGKITDPDHPAFQAIRAENAKISLSPESRASLGLS